MALTQRSLTCAGIFSSSVRLTGAAADSSGPGPAFILFSACSHADAAPGPCPLAGHSTPVAVPCSSNTLRGGACRCAGSMRSGAGCRGWCWANDESAPAGAAAAFLPACKHALNAGHPTSRHPHPPPAAAETKERLQEVQGGPKPVEATMLPSLAVRLGRECWTGISRPGMSKKPRVATQPARQVPLQRGSASTAAQPLPNLASRPLPSAAAHARCHAHPGRGTGCRPCSRGTRCSSCP